MGGAPRAGSGEDLRPVCVSWPGCAGRAVPRRGGDLGRDLTGRAVKLALRLALRWPWVTAARRRSWRSGCGGRSGRRMEPSVNRGLFEAGPPVHLGGMFPQLSRRGGPMWPPAVRFCCDLPETL